MDNKTIIQQVNEIRNAVSQGNYDKAELSSKFPDFAKSFPTLFEMAIKDSFNFEEFQYMLEMRQKMLDGSETLETASNKISTVFFNKYHPNHK